MAQGCARLVPAARGASGTRVLKSPSGVAVCGGGCPPNSDTLHILRRGTTYTAAHHLHTILGNDDRPRTLHTEAEHTPRQHLPAEVAEALDRNDQRRTARRETWRHDKARERTYAAAYEQMVNRFHSAERSRERGRAQEADGLEL